MAQVAYVNGAYVPHGQAVVAIEDRGYQFADGIYEYIAFYNQTLLDGDLHFARLERSLSELSMQPPMGIAALRIVARELINRAGRTHGGLYIQITRGVAKRDHPFPKQTKPSLVMTICGPKTPKPREMEQGVEVISQPDLRWARCDIKTVSLLANVLAKQEASKRQAREAWLVDEESMVSEGAVSNSYIITPQHALVTHPADRHILPGVTRAVLLALARKEGIAVEERAFSLQEAKQAQEAFLTSTSANVLPVVKIDGQAIGSGKPGPLTKKLQQLYYAHVYKQTGFQF